MSEPVQAIKAALGLYHLPACLKAVRCEPLPAGIEHLLRIASGDCDALSSASKASERAPDVIREAAVFYIEQVLFSPDANYYRVLGGTPDSAGSELRRNMALLLTWLHPDKDPTGERSHLTVRVTAAWDTLRSPERRIAHDRTLALRRPSEPPVTRSTYTARRPAGPLWNEPSWENAPPAYPPDRNAPRSSRSHGLLDRGLLYLRRILRDRVAH
jgi:hypothetical protein